MITTNGRSRNESGDTKLRTQVQMRAWRKKNSSQLGEFQSLYGSLSDSLNEDDLKANLHSNSNNSNPNNSSRSINRNSSKEESFYSIDSDNEAVLVSDQQLNDYKDEDFKSFRDNNSVMSLNQVGLVYGTNTATPRLKGTTDEERDTDSSFYNQGFHTPKNHNSDENIEETFKLSYEQHIYKNSNQLGRQSDIPKGSQLNNQYQILNLMGRQSLQPNAKQNFGVPISINSRNSSSGQEDSSSRSSVMNQSNPYTGGQKNSRDEARKSVGQPLIEGQKKPKNSVHFPDSVTAEQYYSSSNNYKPPSYNGNQYAGGYTNSQGQFLYQDPQQSHHKKLQSKVNRGKSLSTLKRMIDQNQPSQPQDESVSGNSISQNNFFTVQSLNSSQGQQQQANHSSILLTQQSQQYKMTSQSNTQSSSQQGRISQAGRASTRQNSITPSSQSNQLNSSPQTSSQHSKKLSYTVLPQPPQLTAEEIMFQRKISQQQSKKKASQQSTIRLQSSQEQVIESSGRQSSSQKKNSSSENTKNLNSIVQEELQEFLYYEKLKKKQQIKRIAHNNRLIERKKDEVRSKPSFEQKQSKFTLNLTLLISIILEKHPKLQYLLFLNHVIGAIARGFVYSFLIIISIKYNYYFYYFGPAIALTRFYYLISMYYVLFYFEQKSLSFRKVSKIFNNCFHLPNQYKKPVMSEMIDMMNQNQRDQEEKLMKRKFIFCPVEINYLCLPDFDRRKKWNLFYISNFIYQGMESIILFPLVITFTVIYYKQDAFAFVFNSLLFARYIIAGALGLFLVFCMFLLIYGNRHLKFQ